MVRSLDDCFVVKATFLWEVSFFMNQTKCSNFRKCFVLLFSCELCVMLNAVLCLVMNKYVLLVYVVMIFILYILSGVKKSGTM